MERLKLQSLQGSAIPGRGRTLYFCSRYYLPTIAFMTASTASTAGPDVQRASFEPKELALLTMEFYRRNYIEGLFLSSAVEVSPDHTAERILNCIRLLRVEYGFAGYIHAKIIPGVSPEILHEIGLVADRLSINIELPTKESLSLLAPQKKPKNIFTPMKQITQTLTERRQLERAGNHVQKSGYL